MRTIAWGHLLLFLIALPLTCAAAAAAADAKKNARKPEGNATDWNHVKTRQVFPRQKISPPQGSHIPKHKLELLPPLRRCSRIMESCSSAVPCCDPCASCRCRLFNTICHCWRMSRLCLKRT